MNDLGLMFQNAAGAKVNVLIGLARQGLAEAEVAAVQRVIIEKNIFQTGGGDLVATAGAEYLTKNNKKEC